MRFIGVAAVCLAFSLSGIYVSFIKKKRIKVLFDTADFFSGLSDEVKLRRGDVLCCIENICARDGGRTPEFINEIKEKCCSGCNVKEVWNDCISRSSLLKFFPSVARDRLFSFSDNLGKLPPDVFCEKCRIYADAFRKIATGENEKWEKSRTLITSSGVLCAAAVFFILL